MGICENITTSLFCPFEESRFNASQWILPACGLFAGNYDIFLDFNKIRLNVQQGGLFAVFKDLG